LGVLRRRWLVLLTVSVPLFVGVLTFTQSLPAAYDARAVVAFAPRPEANIGGDIIRVTLPKYVSYLTAAATLRRLSPMLGEDPDELDSAVDVSVTTDTANLTITVRLPTGARAAAAANTLAAEVLVFARTDALLAAGLVAPAVESRTPASPPRRLLGATGLVVALLAGTAAAFVAERGRPRVRTPADVVEITGQPVIGRIPPSRSLRSTPADAFGDPAVGGAMRSLRTYIERTSRPSPIRVLAVTSAVAGEGKTTVATAFAASVARLDARVCLLDADLHRPRVAGAFGVESRPGLGDLLRGKASLDECLQKTALPGLVVMAAAYEIDAGDLLARRFVEVLTQLRERFDVVIVDCPPLLGTDDARTLATQVDGILLVTSSGSLARPLSEATAVLDSLGVRVVGVVINRFRSRVERYDYALSAAPGS